MPMHTPPNLSNKRSATPLSYLQKPTFPMRPLTGLVAACYQYSLCHLTLAIGLKGLLLYSPASLTGSEPNRPNLHPRCTPYPSHYSSPDALHGFLVSYEYSHCFSPALPGADRHADTNSHHVTGLRLLLTLTPPPNPTALTPVLHAPRSPPTPPTAPPPWPSQVLTDTACIVRRAGSGVTVPAGVVARFLAATEPLLPACSAPSLAGLADALTVFTWVGIGTRSAKLHTRPSFVACY